MTNNNYVVIGVVGIVVFGLIALTLIILAAPAGSTDEMIAFRVGLVTAFIAPSMVSLLALMQGAQNGRGIAQTQKQINGHTSDHVALNNGVVELARDAIKAAVDDKKPSNFGAEEGTPST